MITFKHFVSERKESEITAGDISLFISHSMNLITKHKSANKKAADVYYDIMTKSRDAFIKWLEKNAVPIWEKYGYPEQGSQAWGRYEEEFKWNFLIDVETPEMKSHYKKLQKNWKRS